MKGLKQFIMEALNYDSTNYDLITLKDKKDIKKLKFDKSKFGYVVSREGREIEYLGKSGGKFTRVTDVEKCVEFYSEKELTDAYDEILELFDYHDVTVIRIDNK